MNRPTLYITCGLPFSGKTTLAKELSESAKAKMIAYDWIWAREKPPEQVPDPDNLAEWESVLDKALKEIEVELQKGNSLVFDHINHAKTDRDKLRKIAQDNGANFVIIYLNIPFEIIKQRREENLINSTRHHVISVILEKVHKAWEDPKGEKDVVEYKAGENLDDFFKRLLIAS